MEIDTKRIKNILLSKCFASNAITVEKNVDISSNQRLNISFNTNIMVKYPEYYSYLSEYVKLVYHELFENITTISCVNSFGSSLSNFLSYILNVKLVNYYSLKELVENNLQANEHSNESLLFLFDVLSSEEYLQDIIEVLNKNNYENKKFLCLLDKSITEDSKLDKSILYSIFKESDIYEFLNPNISMDYFSNKIANNIYELALTKKSNIILSCNLNNMDDICNCIHRVGSHILAVKINSENIYNFHREAKERLKYLKKIYNLFLIDDRKIMNEYDINFKLLKSKLKTITDWADATTVHSICGHNVIDDIDEKDSNMDLNLILINEYNSNNEYLNKYYKNASNELIKNKNICGLMSKKNIFNEKECLKNYTCLTITPEYDNIQTYRNKNKLLWNISSDLLKIDNMENMMEKYKKEGFEYFVRY